MLILPTKGWGMQEPAEDITSSLSNYCNHYCITGFLLERCSPVFVTLLHLFVQFVRINILRWRMSSGTSRMDSKVEFTIQPWNLRQTLFKGTVNRFYMVSQRDRPRISNTVNFKGLIIIYIPVEFTVSRIGSIATLMLLDWQFRTNQWHH